MLCASWIRTVLFLRQICIRSILHLIISQSLTGEEKSWVEEHGDIRIGFLDNDPAIFSMDEETGKLTGMLAEYISYAKDCLGNQILEFNMQAYDDYDEMLQALQDREIDMIFYVGRNPNLAEEKWLCTYKYSLDLQPDGGNR